MDNKRDQLSDIHNRAKTAKATLKEVEAAAEYEGNIVALQREVGWAYVEQAEQVGRFSHLRYHTVGHLLHMDRYLNSSLGIGANERCCSS